MGSELFEGVTLAVPPVALKVRRKLPSRAIGPVEVMTPWGGGREGTTAEKWRLWGRYVCRLWGVGCEGINKAACLGK